MTNQPVPIEPGKLSLHELRREKDRAQLAGDSSRLREIEVEIRRLMMEQEFNAGSKLRQWSFLVFVAGVVGPAIWAYFAAAPIYEVAKQPGQGLKELEAMGLIFRAAAVTSAFSFLATGIGIAAFFAEPAPRPKRLIWEIAVMLVVALVPASILLEALDIL